jgi:phosphoserine phosphatase
VLKQWLSDSDHDLDGSYFYSDSINDISLLELVDIPVAVNPDEELKAIAQARNWKMIDLL